VADSSPTPTAGPTPSSCVALGTYTVVTGDTLWDIARQYGVTVGSLLAANPQITDRRLIHPGDEITISPLYLGALGGHGALPRASTTVVRSSARVVRRYRTTTPSSG
jgi:LysM repeat protein